MDTQQMVNLVTRFVLENDYVTFVELDQLLAPHIPTKGDMAMTVGHENLIVWAGMSPEFAEVIDQCIESKQVVYRSASTLAYATDGAMLTFLVARRIPKSGYKRPHWLPVCLRRPDVN